MIDNWTEKDEVREYFLCPSCASPELDYKTDFLRFEIGQNIICILEADVWSRELMSAARRRILYPQNNEILDLLKQKNCSIDFKIDRMATNCKMIAK